MKLKQNGSYTLNSGGITSGAVEIAALSVPTFNTAVAQPRG
jgi:hypothetical protein